MTLIRRMRKFNRILQRTAKENVGLDEVITALSEETESNVYIINNIGELMGYYHSMDFTPDDEYADFLDKKAAGNEKIISLKNIKEPLINIDRIDHRVINLEKDIDISDRFTSIIPVVCSRDRLATLILNNYERKLSDEEILIAEYCASICSIIIIKGYLEEEEEDRRQKQIVEQAVNTLSYSELEAIEHIFNELDGNEGLVVASKVADKVGITRSVIVNALRKFESAGVIKSRSLGMKGTHIQVLNEKLMEELKRKF